MGNRWTGEDPGRLGRPARSRGPGPRWRGWAAQMAGPAEHLCPWGTDGRERIRGDWGARPGAGAPAPGGGAGQPKWLGLLSTSAHGEPMDGRGSGAIGAPGPEPGPRPPVEGLGSPNG